MQVVETYTLGLARRVGQDTTLEAPRDERKTLLSGMGYSRGYHNALRQGALSNERLHPRAV